jgi:UDP-N-acetyl-D-mannosaminuronic acid dehydrogenase
VTLSDLRKKIESREAELAVIGLGYVGLPVACMFARAGFTVNGVEIKPELVSKIKSGISPIEGEEPGLARLLQEVVDSGHLHTAGDYKRLLHADIVLIDVETPVDQDHEPDYSALKSACRSLGRVLKTGALVIVESTIAPGTTDKVVRPTLESTSGKRLERDFYLGVCPERVMPGKLLNNLRTMSRVCGGSTHETAETMIVLYSTIVEADLDAADTLTAELVKTTENAYRDVQIAFANEVALICEAAGGDVWRVRDLVNKSPYRQMHLPGAGVGGHCIPKDPWLLAYTAKGVSVPLHLIPAARAVNDWMPFHILHLLQESLIEADRTVLGARVLILGYAYLEDSDDVRNSPSAILKAQLDEMGAEPILHDPYIQGYQGNLLEFAKGCDAVVLMVRHRPYLELDLVALYSVLATPIFIDGRGVYNPVTLQSAGFTVRSIGRGLDQA